MACGPDCPPLRGNYRRCHCSVCHETFSGERAFTIHRRGGQCDTSKLINRNGIWGGHGNDSRWQ